MAPSDSSGPMQQMCSTCTHSLNRCPFQHFPLIARTEWKKGATVAMLLRVCVDRMSKRAWGCKPHSKCVPLTGNYTPEQAAGQLPPRTSTLPFTPTSTGLCILPLCISSQPATHWRPCPTQPIAQPALHAPATTHITHSAPLGCCLHHGAPSPQLHLRRSAISISKAASCCVTCYLLLQAPH